MDTAKSQLASLTEIVKQHSLEINKLYEIISKQNGAYYADHDEHLTIKNQVASIHEKLDSIIQKVDHTNGTVKYHTKILIVVFTALGVLLITNGSPLIAFLTAIIK